MDGVLIFVRPPHHRLTPRCGLDAPPSRLVYFPLPLPSFAIDKIRGLQADPAQQTVYYLQQNVALLAQISQQLSSIAPQVPIPSTPPPPYPTFIPSSSDIRVNVYWFMSLIFSLSAALLATLVQQWVRDYMHVFQRYSHPLKSARLRQYLYEGVEGWYMLIMADSVPALLHLSLFLFFLGLGDSLLNLKHDCRDHHHYSYYTLRPFLHFHYVCASHLPTITISKLILGIDLVPGSENARTEIRRSGFWWCP